MKTNENQTDNVENKPEGLTGKNKILKTGGMQEDTRKKMAISLVMSPKDQRNEMLDTMKRSKEYWIERDQIIQRREEHDKVIEIEDDGTLQIQRKTLYHGSKTGGIKKFNLSDDNTTIGDGVYLTTASSAYNYAHGRKNKEPTIYETTIQNVKIADLRKQEKLDSVLKGFSVFLEKEFDRDDLKKIRSDYVEDVRDTIRMIHDEHITMNTIQKVTNVFSKKFSEYLLSLGYDGLVGIEGGEAGHYGTHDSWVIFDPEKVHIVEGHFVGKVS